MPLRAIADTLLIAGALNWGTIAVTNGNVNPVEAVTGNNRTLTNIIYGAVGAAGVYAIVANLTPGVRKLKK